jgi:hypothetical protein
MREWLHPQHAAAGGEVCPRDAIEKFPEVDVVEHRAPEYEIERLLAKRLLHIRNAKLEFPGHLLVPSARELPFGDVDAEDVASTGRQCAQRGVAGPAPDVQHTPAVPDGLAYERPPCSLASARVRALEYVSCAGVPRATAIVYAAFVVDEPLAPGALGFRRHDPTKSSLSQP